jgi:hypothetical protein
MVEDGARERTKQLNLTPIHACRVHSGICVLTECNLLLWSKSVFRATPKRTIRWADLTQIDITDNVVHLHRVSGVTKIVFLEQVDAQFQEQLTNILVHVLTDSEISRLKFSPNTHAVPTPFGCFCRFLGALTPGIEIDASDIRLVQNIVRFGRHSVSLTEFAEPHFLDISFFRMLATCPSLETLEIASLFDKSREFFLIARHFSLVCSHVQFLRIDAEVCLFPQFLASLSHNVGLKGLSLCNSRLNPDELDMLYSYALENRLESLEFRSALLPYCQMLLTEAILRPPIGDSLRSLVLYGASWIIVPELLRTVPYLHHLGLVNCQFAVVDALRHACRPGLALRMLDLSENLVLLDRPNFVIPNRLKAVLIDSMVMEHSVLFLFLVRNLPANSFLSMRNTFIDNSSWDAWMGSEDVKASRIASLRLDGTPIGSGFIRILRASHALTSLSLSYCLGQEDGDLIKLLGDFVGDSLILKRLTLRGDADKFLGTQFPSFVRAIAGSHSLKEVDLAGHQCPAQMVVELESFFQATRHHLAYLVIDGSLTQPALLSLLDFVIEHNLIAQLSFPDEDLSRMFSPKEQARYDSYLARFSVEENVWLKRFQVRCYSDQDASFWTSREAREIEALPDSAFAPLRGEEVRAPDPPESPATFQEEGKEENPVPEPSRSDVAAGVAPDPRDRRTGRGEAPAKRPFAINLGNAPATLRSRPPLFDLPATEPEDAPAEAQFSVDFGDAPATVPSRRPLFDPPATGPEDPPTTRKSHKHAGDAPPEARATDRRSRPRHESPDPRREEGRAELQSAGHARDAGREGSATQRSSSRPCESPAVARDDAPPKRNSDKHGGDAAREGPTTDRRPPPHHESPDPRGEEAPPVASASHRARHQPHGLSATDREQARARAEQQFARSQRHVRPEGPSTHRPPRPHRA